ncbi:MAG: 30S ribosomal protein S3 [Cyanophyceae cyanobacterium]|jgi:small subunit ribosomal protein S3
MGQKIHPNGFRLGVIKSHRSQWFADPARYPALLQEDLKIRTYIMNKLDPESDGNRSKDRQSKAGISDIIISRKADQIELEIKAARPGVVVGRGGSGLEDLRQGLQKEMSQPGTTDRAIRINVTEVAQVDADATLLGKSIAEQLERRIAFRRIVRQVIQRSQRAGVKGIKIQISGRLNGAEIARTEWTREGRVPLHTLRADIDYAETVARTTFGIIGVKVWVFKGEVMPGQDRGDQAAPSALPQPRRRQQRRRPNFEDRSDAKD